MFRIQKTNTEDQTFVCRLCEEMLVKRMECRWRPGVCFPCQTIHSVNREIQLHGSTIYVDNTERVLKIVNIDLQGDWDAGDIRNDGIPPPVRSAHQVTSVTAEELLIRELYEAREHMVLFDDKFKEEVRERAFRCHVQR